MKVTLPWPDKALSPNARTHWAKLAAAKKRARTSAAFLTATIPVRERQAIAHGQGPIPVRITFYPPDRRHRDDDNCIAAFKASRDGIADMLGVDDRRFRPHYFFEEPEKPGWIEVQFGGEA